jgi:guanylate kinase
MPEGRLFIVSGPSGAGKGTLVKELLARVPRLLLSVSATTRAPRPGEVEGVSYAFVSAECFDELVHTDGLLEWAEVHGNRYGTPREPVERALAQGADVVLEIDPQGAAQVKSRMPESVLIFITAPSLEELRRRLQERGSETDEQVERRLKTALEELRVAGSYDYVVENDDVRRATDALVRIVESRGSGPVSERESQK